MIKTDSFTSFSILATDKLNTSSMFARLMVNIFAFSFSYSGRKKLENESLRNKREKRIYGLLTQTAVHKTFIAFKCDNIILISSSLKQCKSSMRR